MQHLEVVSLFLSIVTILGIGFAIRLCVTLPGSWLQKIALTLIAAALFLIVPQLFLLLGIVFLAEIHTRIMKKGKS